MRRKGRDVPGQQGFSLLELLVVLSVMGILLGAAVPGIHAIRRWLARIETEALFAEIQTACRLLYLERGDWPPSMGNPELSFQDMQAAWRDDLARHMETDPGGPPIRDGLGNSAIYVVVDLDGDRWIREADFEALPVSLRPEAIRGRAAVYSLSGRGELAFSSWSE